MDKINEQRRRKAERDKKYYAEHKDEIAERVKKSQNVIKNTETNTKSKSQNTKRNISPNIKLNLPKKRKNFMPKNEKNFVPNEPDKKQNKTDS